MKTIKTLTLSATLAAMFLSAGAFANVSASKAPGETPVAIKANLTVIHKNSPWPKKLPLNPCAIKRCVEV
jgi:hypothetical protein